MTGAMTVVCMVSVISGIAIHDERVGPVVYKNIRVAEGANQTVVSFTIVNNGRKAQTVCAPVILAKTPTNKDRFILSLNNQSSGVPSMVPGQSYKLRFVFPGKGDGRLMLYGGGFRFAASKHIYRY